MDGHFSDPRAAFQEEVRAWMERRLDDPFTAAAKDRALDPHPHIPTHDAKADIQWRST